MPQGKVEGRGFGEEGREGLVYWRRHRWLPRNVSNGGIIFTKRQWTLLLLPSLGPIATTG